jgi:hypothetical protein
VRAPYERTPGSQEVTLTPYRITESGHTTDFCDCGDLQVEFQPSMVNPAQDLADVGIAPYTYKQMRRT